MHIDEKYPADTATGSATDTAPGGPRRAGFRWPYSHLTSPFGDDWFGVRAEKFARFFGTPTFLVGQTVIVGLWIAINVFGWARFDAYPFILLNLMFSLQAAYAAPLILLAQTRQADRDKLMTARDAQHREDLARATAQRQAIAEDQAGKLLELLAQNTELTELTRQLGERVAAMTAEIHGRVVGPAAGGTPSA